MEEHSSQMIVCLSALLLLKFSTQKLEWVVSKNVFLKKIVTAGAYSTPPHPPKKTQLQSLHSNVMPTWEPTPKLNSCVIPWLNTISEYTYLYISKNISYTFLLLFKTVESLQFILKWQIQSKISWLCCNHEQSAPDALKIASKRAIHKTA